MSECVKRVSLHSQVIVKTRQKSATIFSTGGQAVFSTLIKSMSSVIYRCFSQWVKLLPRGGFRFLARVNTWSRESQCAYVRGLKYFRRESLQFQKGFNTWSRESLCLCQEVKILQKGVITVSIEGQNMVKGIIVFLSGG